MNLFSNSQWISLCRFFTEIIVFVDNTREDMSTKLERWKETLKSNGWENM